MASILVIDNNEGVRQLLRLVLEGAGHRVRQAADGAEGLARFREEPADLVLCDIFTDGLDGLGALRKTHPSARVVVMSGGSVALPVDWPRAALLGAAACVPKPLDMALLRETVARVLRG